MPAARDYRPLLGATIRAYRKRAGFSLEALAEKADLHHNFLGRVERGEEYISVSALLRISKALRVTMPDLFKDVS